MSIRIRRATEKDLDFVTWAMLTASRSQLDRGIWEYLLDASEDDTLAFLRRLGTTQVVHMNHLSLFLVAEVDGEPAAAMCAYDSSTQGFSVVGAEVPAAASACGFDVTSGEFARRAGVMMSGFFHQVELPPVMWTIECVATLPSFRRRGLADALLVEHLRHGRELGYEHASIGVYLGNDPARAAYLKAGFDIVSEVRSPGWDAEIGCPGTELMVRAL